MATRVRAKARAADRARAGRPVRARPGRPPGADADATRLSILEGALEAFASTGYEGVSVRELTRRLGVSHNLVHHYFGSKENLWREVVDYTLGDKLWEIFEMIEAAEETDDPFEMLEAALRRVVALAARLPALPRLLAGEANWVAPRLDYVFDRYLEPLTSLSRRLLARAEAAGAVPMDPRSFLLFVGIGAMSLFSHASIARKLGGPDPFSDEAIQTHADTVVGLVLRGMRPAV
jgi:AcrR family transcriptional regulator